MRQSLLRPSNPPLDLSLLAYVVSIVLVAPLVAWPFVYRQYDSVVSEMVTAENLPYQIINNIDNSSYFSNISNAIYIYVPYGGSITHYGDFDKVEVSFNMGIAYNDSMQPNVQVLIRDFFPTGYPFPVDQLALGSLMIARLFALDNSSSTLLFFTIQPNGYDIFVDLAIQPDTPPQNFSQLYFYGSDPIFFNYLISN